MRVITRWQLIYTHQKGLATLNPVAKKRNNHLSNGHIIVNTACIHFHFKIWHNEYSIYARFKTIGIMENIGIHSLHNLLCNVNIFLKNHF